MKMKLKKLTAVLCTIIMITALAGCSKTEYTLFEPAADDEIRVVSFNCAAPWGNVIKGTGSGTRVKKFAAYMNSIKPDSIGTQEMNQKWLDKLSELMSDYSSYGVIRGGDENENKSEMNAVFWLKDKYTAVAKGTFWLSETPETESRYEGAGCYRICTWVVLKSNESGEQYIHMNTHLDNASEEAANYGAEVIKAKIAELSESYGGTIVLTGDFNETAGMPAYNTIAEILDDTKESAMRTENKTTYQGWGEADFGEPIDYIFTDSGLTVSQFRILDDTSNGYISDHYGIMADISISQS